MALKPDIGEAKGPQYDVARAIKSFLGQMAEGGIKLGAAVIKELMQNADDAGAKEMSVFLDERPVPPRFDDNYARLTLPALLVRNNAPFRKKDDADWGGTDDFDSLCDIAAGYKRTRSTAAGRFGIGFNSVYFFTDTPIIFSRRELHVFDPLHQIFDENGWQFPLDAFPADASSAGSIKEILNWALPKDSLSFDRDFGDIAGDNLDYRQAILRLPLRQSDEGSRSLYSDCFLTSESRRELLRQMWKQAARSILFLKSLRHVEFGLLRESGPEGFVRVEATPNPPVFEEFISQVEKESDRFEKGRRCECELYERSITVNQAGKEESIWTFCLKHCADFNQEEIVELRNRLHKNEERAIPWVSIAIPKDSESLKFDGGGGPAWRVFLPLLEKGPCSCVLNGAFFVGPSRQRAEFRSDGSDEALRKTVWNKSLIKNILIPMLRNISIELTDLVPDLIKQNPQDYLNLFPTALKGSDQIDSISTYFQKIFSEDLWCLKCFDIWDEEFEMIIGEEQDRIMIEMIIDDLTEYKDCFRHLTNKNRKFIPWKLGDAVNKRLGETSGVSVLRNENMDVLRSILTWEYPPKVKDLSFLIERFFKRLDRDLVEKGELAGLWAFKKADNDELLRYDESALYVIEDEDDATDIHSSLKKLGVSFESTYWVRSEHGLPGSDPYSRQDFTNLMKADDRAALELLRRVEGGDLHDRVEKNSQTKPIVDFLCQQEPESLPKDLKIAFLVKTASQKHAKRSLGIILLKPENPTKNDKDVWEGLLRKTFAEVDPGFREDLQILIRHAPGMKECLHTSECRLEIAKSGKLLDVFHRAIQSSPDVCRVFKEELNRKASGESLPREEAYRAARIVLQEAVERWDELDEAQRRTVLSLPIHHAADGSLVSLIDAGEDETTIKNIQERFYLQSEDDLKDAPITLPDRRLLHVDRTTYSFYREKLRIDPHDRTTVLKECLNQIGDAPALNQRLLEYIARYLPFTLEELEREGDPLSKSTVEVLNQLLENARLVPCTDNSWHKSDECVLASRLAEKLRKQGWKGKDLDALVTKLAFPTFVAKYDSGLARFLQQLGIKMTEIHAHEIPVIAIQSESPEFSLSERAKVIIKNKESLPREQIDRAAVIGDFECPSLGGKAGLKSLKLIDTSRLKLPINVIKNILPEAADIPAIARECQQSEPDVNDLLSLLGVHECKADEINSRLTEHFPGLWPDIDGEDRISVLEYIGARRDLAKQIEPHVDELEVVRVEGDKNTWRTPASVISPKWAEMTPPNLPPHQLPNLTGVPEKIISLWNEWCGLKNAITVVEAVVGATKSVTEGSQQKAWNDFVKWLEKIIRGSEGDEIISILGNLEWVLGLKGNIRKFMRSSDTINHPGAQVLAAEFWVVDGKLPRSIATRIDFKSIPKTTETLSAIAKCLTLAESFSPYIVYQVYKLVDELLRESEDFKELWSGQSAKRAVYRLMREPEQMATRMELFLGDNEHTSDYGKFLWCFSEKAKGEENFLKNTREIYRRVGVKIKPTIFHAIGALSKIEGNYRENKEQYTSLVNLITRGDSHQYELEDEMVKKIRVLTCAETFEGVESAYLDSELNRAELLSEFSQGFIINNRNRATGALANWLNEKAPSVLKKLGDVARIELTSAPQSVEVSKSASNVLGPWKDWFEQLTFEGSDIRERVKEKLNLEPPAQTFKLIPVKQIMIKYRLPDGNEIIPSKEWDGPQALHDSEKRIFVLKDQIEKDYLGKPEELERFDGWIAEQVGRLLFQVAEPLNGSSCHLEDVLQFVSDLTRKTLERPSVTLDRLRRERQSHFFHQYQDQTADPKFLEIFEVYQGLHQSAKNKRDELETKMREIIDVRFVEERRAQIKGYGYDKFSVFAELVQNAEDAYLQGGEIGLPEPSQRSVVFAYVKNRVLIVEHYGRPFNYWRHGSIEKPNFKRDVEGVLRSAGSFKPHEHDPSKPEQPIGRFGLGFKSVYLITNEPIIHSGQWHFKIESACIPHEIMVPDDLPVGCTRIVLPLAKGVKEEDPKVERLVNLMPFLRQVGKVELKNSDGSSISLTSDPKLIKDDKAGNIIEIVELNGVKHVSGDVIKILRFRKKESAEQLGIYLAPDGLPAHWEDAFGKDTFAVLPLSVHLGCGIGISHHFELQSGRTHLIDPEGNRPRFEAVANLLRSLPDAIACCVNEDNRTRDVLLRLWSIFRWDRGDKETFMVRQAIARVLMELAQHSEIVPTMDPEKCVSLADQPVFCFKGIPSEFGEDLIKERIEVSVGDKSGILSRENVVPDLFRRAYEATCRMSGIKPENLLEEIGWAEIGRVLKEKDLLAERPQLLSAMARSLSDEDLDKVKEWLSSCLLLADDGSRDMPKNLLPRNFPGCNHLPFHKMRQLHENYDQTSVELLKRVGLPSRPSIEDVELWIREGLAQNECVGLLKYMAEAGRWRRDFYRTGELLRQPWFDGVEDRLTTNFAYKKGLIPEEVIVDQLFSVWLGITADEEKPTLPLPPPPVVDVRGMLERIYDWWQNESQFYISEYEKKVYPDGKHPRLKRHLRDRDTNERRDWLILFLLACSHTMGRTKYGYHREFIRMCEQRGWLQVFIDPNSSADNWIDVLEKYLEEPIEDHEYYHWMRQFVSIYQVSKWLDDYVQTFLEIETRKKPFSLDLIVKPRKDYWIQRGGPDPPPVNRALGMGACFVVRELVRTGILNNSLVFPNCYVPVKRVRDIFSQDLGCTGLSSISSIEASRRIYDFLSDPKRLGTEKATFNLTFDLPFLVLADNESLKYDYLHPKFI